MLKKRISKLFDIMNEIKTYLIWHRILYESHKKSIPKYQRSLFDYETPAEACRIKVGEKKWITLIQNASQTEHQKNVGAQ